MAPPRSAEAHGPGEAHGLPRDHQRGDPRRHRQLARPRHEARRGAGRAAGARSARRLRGLQRRVPPHRARNLRGTRAERRHPARRRPGARADGVPRRELLGPRRRRSGPRGPKAGRRFPPRSPPSTAGAWRRGATSIPTRVASPMSPRWRSSTRRLRAGSPPASTADRSRSRRWSHGCSTNAPGRRSSRRPCNRRRAASSGSAPRARCTSPRDSTSVASSPTCAPTPRRCQRRPCKRRAARSARSTATITFRRSHASTAAR